MHSTAQKFHTTLPSPENISILLVSPLQDDYSTLRNILHHECWSINRCRTVEEVATRLASDSPSIVICECDLPDGTWKDVLARLDESANHPLLVVASRRADETLWGEVLNSGGYDVLVKPFDRSEVTQVLGMAWRHWFRSMPAELAPQYA